MFTIEQSNKLDEERLSELYDRLMVKWTKKVERAKRERMMRRALRAQ